MDEQKKKVVLGAVAGVLFIIAAYLLITGLGGGGGSTPPPLDPELQRKLDAERAANPEKFKEEPPPPNPVEPGARRKSVPR